MHNKNQVQPQPRMDFEPGRLKTSTALRRRSIYGRFVGFAYELGIYIFRLAGLYPFPLEEGRGTIMLRTITFAWSAIVVACTTWATGFYYTLESSPQSIPDLVAYIYVTCVIVISRCGNLYLMCCSRTIVRRLIQVHRLALPYTAVANERPMFLLMLFFVLFTCIRLTLDIVVYQTWLTSGFFLLLSIFPNESLSAKVMVIIVIALDQVNYYVSFVFPVFYSAFCFHTASIFRNVSEGLEKRRSESSAISCEILDRHFKDHAELTSAVGRLHHILSPYLLLVFALHVTEIFHFVGEILQKQPTVSTLLLHFGCAACILAMLVAALIHASTQVREPPISRKLHLFQGDCFFAAEMICCR